MIINLSDCSRLSVKYNGSRYKLVAMENEKLFNYMQSCKINVRQNHKRLDVLIKCIESALFQMSYKPPCDDYFKSSLCYNKKKTFSNRNYSEFIFK